MTRHGLGSNFPDSGNFGHGQQGQGGGEDAGGGFHGGLLLRRGREGVVVVAWCSWQVSQPVEGLLVI